ncbi:hypothetical protein Ocin01_13967, partial [Orchesella cincta]
MASYSSRRRRVKEQAQVILQSLRREVTEQCSLADPSLHADTSEDLRPDFAAPAESAWDVNILDNTKVFESVTTENVVCSSNIELQDSSLLKPQIVTENLPICSKTLLKTPRKLQIQRISGGHYYYFGIRTHLEKAISMEKSKFQFPIMEPFNISNLLTLSISTDGIPICKSTGLGMWPILMKVDQVRAAGPYLCALFSGETKPSSISEFMKPFLEELTNLENEGIEFGGVHYSIRVSSVIADAPARSFVKAIKGHTGYHSCERCIDDGEWC